MSQQTAGILEREDASITFAVDAVTPAEALREMKTMHESLEGKLERPLLDCSDAQLKVVDWDKGRMHPLIYAVFTAFSEHRPLCLRPDDVWLTIAQGFSNHVNQHATQLCERFVRHEGKKKLTVTTPLIPSPRDFAVFIPQWAALVREDLIDPAIHDALVCDFSTTTPTIRVASQIVLMETFQQYFYYELYAICGIPTVTLYGTVEDWQSIRDRVQTLAQYDLDWWTDRLLPICDELIATSQGQPSLSFWQAICAPQEVYGGPVVKGWAADLFPYIGERGEWRNPLFDQPPGDWTRENGISPNSFPPGLSLAPVAVKDRDGNTEHMELVGGFLGVSQDVETLALRPEIGWGIRELNTAAALVQNTPTSTHRLQPPKQEDRFGRPGLSLLGWNDGRVIYPGLFYCADTSIALGELYRLCDGGTLFADTDHPWLLRTIEEICLSQVDATIFEPSFCAGCFTIIDLPDGRNIAFAFVTQSMDREAEKETRVLLGRPSIEIKAKDYSFPSEQPTYPLMHYPASNTRIIANSLEEFFDNVRHAEGHYYFDVKED